MRLINSDLDLDIVLEENKAFVLTVENKQILSEILQMLWVQAQGKEGSFVLSDGVEPVKFDKFAECIFNPFSVECNNKKILGKIYKDMENISKQECYEEMDKLNREILNFFDLIFSKTDYSIDYSMDIDICNLFKMYNVKIEEEDTEFLLNLLNYMKFVHKVCGTEIFIFYGLKNMVEEEQLMQFYDDCFYEKIYVILIEGRFEGKNVKEKGFILDKDRCIINLD